MRAFVLTGIMSGETGEAPEPAAAGMGEVLIQVVSVGICGSDIHYYRTGRIGSQVAQFPFICGHECSGHVLAVGGGVTRVAVGDRIAIEPSVSCGQCDQCGAGREHTCSNSRFLGVPGQLPGALSNRIVLPEENCFPIPDSMSWEQAVMSEPLAIGVYAASRFVDVKDRSVGILGCGPIGLCILEAARHYGARAVYATDPLEYRHRAAARHGAVWAGSPEELDDVIHREEPGGLDVIFECCGMQEATSQSFEVIKPGGVLLMVGIPETDHLTIPIHKARRREVRFFNVRRQVGCVQEALDLIAGGMVDVDGMITHRFALDEARKGFDTVEAYQDGVIKAMINVEPA